MQFPASGNSSGANGGSLDAADPTPSPAPVRDRARIHEMRALLTLQPRLLSDNAICVMVILVRKD